MLQKNIHERMNSLFWFPRNCVFKLLCSISQWEWMGWKAFKIKININRWLWLKNSCNTRLSEQRSQLEHSNTKKSWIFHLFLKVLFTNVDGSAFYGSKVTWHTHSGGASVQSFYSPPGKSFKVVKIMNENNISNCDLFSFTFIASAERRSIAPEKYERLRNWAFKNILFIGFSMNNEGLYATKAEKHM